MKKKNEEKNSKPTRITNSNKWCLAPLWVRYFNVAVFLFQKQTQTHTHGNNKQNPNKKKPSCFEFFFHTKRANTMQSYALTVADTQQNIHTTLYTVHTQYNRICCQLCQLLLFCFWLNKTNVNTLHYRFSFWPFLSFSFCLFVSLSL